MRGGKAHPEAAGDLLFAVAVEQAREGLTQPRGETIRARLRDAHERATHERPQLRMEEAQQSLLAQREVALAGGAVKAEQAERRLRLLVNGEESVLDLPHPEISVVDGRALIVRIPNDLSPGARDGL